MHLTKRAAAGAVTFLLLAAGALAATTAPSGVFQGNLHYTQAGKPTTLPIQATFSKGKLTELKSPGKSDSFIPYDPKKSNAISCGDANTFDTSDPQDPFTITGGVQKDGSFSYKAKDKYHIVITLKGKFVSATKAKTHFRFYQSHLPHSSNGKISSTGHCDSGQLRLKLTAS